MKIDLPAGPLADPTALLEAAERTDGIARKAEKLRDAFNAKAEKLRDEVAQQFAGLDMDNATRQQLIRQQVAKRLNELQREHMTEADAVLREIGADVELMQNSAPMYESKLHVIGRLTLGSPERATFAANLANAGPAELASAAQHAILTGNIALASAVASRVQALPKEARPFEVHGFINRFQVPEYERAQNALSMLRSTTQRAISAQREVRNPSSRLTGRILNAILKPNTEEE